MRSTEDAKREKKEREFKELKEELRQAVGSMKGHEKYIFENQIKMSYTEIRKAKDYAKTLYKKVRSLTRRVERKAQQEMF